MMDSYYIDICKADPCSSMALYEYEDVMYCKTHYYDKIQVNHIDKVYDMGYWFSMIFIGIIVLNWIIGRAISRGRK